MPPPGPAPREGEHRIARAGATLVVGLGRPMGGDDAVGLLVASRLQEQGIPALRVTDAASLIELLLVAERAIVLDGVVGGGPPGSIVTLTGDEVAGRGSAVPVSSHALSVAGAVAIARTLGGAAEVHVIGVSIPPPSGSVDMSVEVRAAVEPAAERARELFSRGI